MKAQGQFFKLTNLGQSKSAIVAKKLFSEKNYTLMKSFSEFQRNSKWVSTNRERLRKKYGDEYIAVYKGEVCMHEKNLPKLVSRINKKYGEENKEVAIDFIGSHKVKLLL